MGYGQCSKIKDGEIMFATGNIYRETGMISQLKHFFGSEVGTAWGGGIR